MNQEIANIFNPVQTPAQIFDQIRISIASPDKIMSDLGWNPRHSELDRIIESAWRWHLAHPNGYEE